MKHIISKNSVKLSVNAILICKILKHISKIKYLHFDIFLIFFSTRSDLTEFENIKKITVETYERLKHDMENTSRALPVANQLEHDLTNDFSKLKLDNAIELNDIIEKYCIDFEFGTNDGNSEEEGVDFSDSDGRFTKRIIPETLCCISYNFSTQHSPMMMFHPSTATGRKTIVVMRSTTVI